MPQLRYLDNDNIYAAGQMGGAFANFANNIAELRYRQALQARKDALEQEYLGLAKSREARLADQEKLSMQESQDVRKRVEDFSRQVGVLNAPRATNFSSVGGGVFPTGDPKEVARQKAMMALGFLAARNSGTAARMMEPQQFRSGPVYSGMFGMGGDQKPIAEIPESKAERDRFLIQQKEASRKAFADKELNFFKQMKQAEDRRHHIEMERKTSAKSRMQQLMDNYRSSQGGPKPSEGGGKAMSRAMAQEYVMKYGGREAAMKRLQAEGYDTSRYAD